MVAEDIDYYIKTRTLSLSLSHLHGDVKLALSENSEREEGLFAAVLHIHEGMLVGRRPPLLPIRSVVLVRRAPAGTRPLKRRDRVDVEDGKVYLSKFKLDDSLSLFRVDVIKHKKETTTPAHIIPARARSRDVCVE